MEEQLQLLDDAEGIDGEDGGVGRAAPHGHRHHDWLLDEETKAVGRLGVAAARQALRRARQHAGRHDDRAA